MTYLALLLAVALTSGALAAGTVVWSHQQRRERETQLLWAGDQIRRAIQSYAAATPEGMARHPARLEDLLDDARSLVPRHHLRRLYHDPMTHGSDWGLLLDERGAVVGVYSRLDARPIKTAGFAADYRTFRKARSYRDWRFSVIARPLDADEAAPGRTPRPLEPAVPSAAGPAPAASAVAPGADDDDAMEGDGPAVDASGDSEADDDTRPREDPPAIPVR